MKIAIIGCGWVGKKGLRNISPTATIT